ncbi:MAG: hypothetical protein ACE5H4_10550 [Candidatus Thorarchaeota archaeon]
MSLSKSPDILGTYAVVASYILMIGGMMILFGTTDPYLTGNILILSLSGILLLGGMLLRVLGAFLWGPGSRRYREEHNVLEIVAMRQSVTISELQTETRVGTLVSALGLCEKRRTVFVCQNPLCGHIFGMEE